MTQPILIQELQITPTTVEATLRAACEKWNKEHSDQTLPPTYKDFLINAHSHWLYQSWSEEKSSDLAEQLCEVFTKGTRGWSQMTEKELLADLFKEGVCGCCVEDGKTLAQMLDENPWLIWEDN